MGIEDSFAFAQFDVRRRSANADGGADDADVSESVVPQAFRECGGLCRAQIGRHQGAVEVAASADVVREPVKVLQADDQRFRLRGK